jgi:osmotically-inducible protein OsmY
MKTKVWLPVMLLALTGLSTACDRPATQEGGPVQLSAKPDDSDIENTIKAKLNSDPGLKAADLEVDADVEKNEVTISGTVESEELRAKAVDLARSAQPNLTVNDEINVKPGQVLG